MSDSYDYTDELSDEYTPLGFGKYSDLTPLQLASTEKGREYIVWAHKHTPRWVGSEQLVRKCHELCNVEYVERSKPAAQAHEAYQSKDLSVAAFERAVVDAYGTFPKPLWMRG